MEFGLFDIHLQFLFKMGAPYNNLLLVPNLQTAENALSGIWNKNFHKTISLKIISSYHKS